MRTEKGGFNLASFDKLTKYMVENFQTALAPLKDVVKNQETIIAQNKQMIDLLERLRTGSILTAKPDLPPEEANLMRNSDNTKD